MARMMMDAGTRDHLDLAAGAGLRAATGAVRARLAGPGGYYNIGNAVGLGMGIALQVTAVPAGALEMQNAAAAIWQYLAGNAAAVALTAATAVFFLSGEAYHRAWAHGAPPDETLNRRGDVLSGIGALILGVALFSLGQVMLAATAGLLHALGKFGSAYHWPTLSGWPRAWPSFYRTAVLASRVPAILAALIGLLLVLAQIPAGAPVAGLLTPLTLLICYALWCKADLLLFAGSDR